MSGRQAVARGIRSRARRAEGPAKRWIAAPPSSSSWLAGGTAFARAQLGGGVGEARPHGPGREAAARHIRDHVGAGGQDDVVPGLASGVHQREHREDVPDERVGGEQTPHGRHWAVPGTGRASVAATERWRRPLPMPVASPPATAQPPRPARPVRSTAHAQRPVQPRPRRGRRRGDPAAGQQDGPGRDGRWGRAGPRRVDGRLPGRSALRGARLRWHRELHQAAAHRRGRAADARHRAGRPVPGQRGEATCT